VTNDLAVLRAVDLLNLCFDQGDEKADKGQEKKGFFHEEKLFVGEGGLPRVFNEVKKDFLGLLQNLGLLLFLLFFIFEVGDFFIGEIDSLPVNVVVVAFGINFSHWLAVISADGFKHYRDSFTHFFFFLFL
jgi:hypothetical protein